MAEETKESQPKSDRLVKEFAKILRSVKPIQKAGKHSKENWPYLRVLDLANALRSRLLAKGILLIPDDVEKWSDSFERDGRRWTEVGVQTQFTITDGRQSLTFASYGIGMDSEGCAMSKAQTMALKAWLKRIGLIFGEYDDQEKGEGPHFGENEVIENPKERAFMAALKQCDLTADRAREIISKRIGMDVFTVEGITELPKKLFDQAMESLYAEIPLTEKLQKSVDQARSKRKSQIQPTNGTEAGA